MVSKPTTLPTGPIAGHSPLGASSAHIWMNCPASIKLRRELGGGSKDTHYNVEGNLAHDVAAQCILNGQDAWELIGTQRTVGDITEIFDPEDADSVQSYLDFLRGQSSLGQQWIEVNFHVPEIHESFFGTSDYVNVDDKFQVVDYKHGKGIAVGVENNPQLMMYALGAIYFARASGSLIPERVELVIVQPRAWHPDGTIRRWETTVSDLELWAINEWLPAAARTESENPDFMAGEWCRFCPAILDCPLTEEKRKNILGVTPERIKAMTNEELADLNIDLEHFVFVKREAQNETYARLMSGHVVPGSKLVNSKTNRVWRPEAEKELVAEYGDDIYEKSIKTPAVVEKMPGGSKHVKKYAYKPEGKLTVASENDNRTGRKARAFGDVFKGHLTPKA